MKSQTTRHLLLVGRVVPSCLSSWPPALYQSSSSCLSVGARCQSTTSTPAPVSADKDGEFRFVLHRELGANNMDSIERMITGGEDFCNVTREAAIVTPNMDIFVTLIMLSIGGGDGKPPRLCNSSSLDLSALSLRVLLLAHAVCIVCVKVRACVRAVCIVCV